MTHSPASKPLLPLLLPLLLWAVLLHPDRAFAQAGNWQEQADSLSAALQNTASEKEQAAILQQLAQVYFRLNPDTAYALALRSLELREANGLKQEMVESHKIAAVAAMEANDFPASEMHINRGLELAAANEDQNNLGALYNLKAVLFSRRADFQRALKNYFRALETYQQQKDFASVVQTYVNMGLVYMEQEEYDRALEYFAKATDVGQQNDALPPGIQASIHLNRGLTYTELQQPDKALQEFEQAMKHWRGRNDLRAMANVQLNMAVAHLQKDSTSARAEELFQAALAGYESADDQAGAAYVKYNYAGLLVTTNQLPQAKTYLQEALETMRAVGELNLQMKIHRELSQVHELMGDYAAAYEHHSQFLTLNDSLFNAEKSEEIGRLEARHELEQQEQINQAKEQLVLEHEQRQNNQQYFLIFTALLVLLAVLFFAGRLPLPRRVVETVVFLSLLLFFEFVLVYLDPLLEQYTGGVPLPKLAVNAILAVAFTFLHRFLEDRFRKRKLAKQARQAEENAQQPATQG